MSKLKANIIRKLYHYIPMHMKRMVLWCSIVSAYRRSNEVNSACVKSLNDLLGLARWRNALGMPIQISKVIWEDFDGAVQILHDADDANISVAQRASLRASFFRAIPSWLQYSNEKKVMSDFDKILANKSAVLA